MSNFNTTSDYFQNTIRDLNSITELKYFNFTSDLKVVTKHNLSINFFS